MTHFEIAGRPIGMGHSTYVIAEMSANHAGSFEEAAHLVRAAAVAGVDAVKLQTYMADTMTVVADTPWMKIGAGSPWEGRNLYELYAEAHTPWEWQPDLRKIALEVGIELFSTAFDATSVEFLEEMGVPAHKVASFEIVDHELIGLLASTGKPLIISTGMANLTEIAEAMDVARDNGATKVALLRCTSSYPADPADMHLRSIPVLREAFGVEVGLSDHTLGIDVPIAAVSLGASLVEKHFTRSRDTESADSSFSLSVTELESMVSSIRRVEAALGEPRFGASASEEKSLVFRRSIFAIADIAEGEVLSRRNVGVIRPGHGLAPKFLPQVLGRRANRHIEIGNPILWDVLD